jgi:hydroxypyruvate isomerase
VGRAGPCSSCPALSGGDTVITSSDLVLSTSILLPGVAWQQRPARAAALGYTALESWWPWSVDVASPSDVERLTAALRSSGTHLYMMNLTQGDAEFGRRGIASVPGAEIAFWANADSMLEVAAATGLRYVNALAGNKTDAGGQIGIETLVARLSEFADRAAALGVGVLIEQLNSSDHPDYLLTDPELAIDVVKRLRLTTKQSNVGLLADVYHLGLARVDPVAFVRRNMRFIDHVQIADAPGRGAPGSGALPILKTLESLSAQRYAGRIGLEFTPGHGYQLPGPDEFLRQLRAGTAKMQREDA